jgi:hypothetical protein
MIFYNFNASTTVNPDVSVSGLSHDVFRYPKDSIAPTLANLNSVDWTPNLLTFDALDIVRSASYYTQKMFTNNLGTDVLASDPPNTDTTAPLYFVASKGAGGKTAILKVALLSHTHA